MLEFKKISTLWHLDVILFVPDTKIEIRASCFIFAIFFHVHLAFLSSAAGSVLRIQLDFNQVALIRIKKPRRPGGSCKIDVDG